MPTVSGHVYYTNSNQFTPGTGIANVPVALFNPSGLNGAVALTDAAGSFSFTNVPSGTYQLIEAWGSNIPGTLGNTRPAADPYPGVVPGFSYSTADIIKLVLLFLLTNSNLLRIICNRLLF